MNGYGSEVIITGSEEVKYVGEGENPKDNIGFQIWEKSYREVYGQPERSKREDALKECEEMGHVNTWMPKNQVLCMRCGALNTMET